MSSFRQIRAVVFDLDGLMFNTEELYDVVGETLLERRGKRFTSDLKDAMTGRPGRDALQIMIDWHGLRATVEQLQNETDEIFPDLLATRLTTLPGLIELLDALEAAGIPKAIATSSRRLYATQVLSFFDFEPRFQFVLTAEDAVYGKPHPEIYQTASRRLAQPAANVLVLEDSENGCRAALAAGAATIAVPGAHSRHHDFRGVRLIAESLMDRRIYEVLEL